VQMLDIIDAWMLSAGYKHLRIDGTTAVKGRLRMIEEFNANTSYVAMILTTRVGGVGLNIIGADRIVIFDPDWNPMTDTQARERAWRIGQKREVAIYRLVLTGTIEEKVYQRQVYKHNLTQKVINDARQRQFFRWADLHDLFEMPPVPPDFNAEDMTLLKKKYSQLFKRFNRFEEDDDETAETTVLMKAITNMPTPEQHVLTQDTAKENNALLQTLFDTQGIKAVFNHDKVEQPLLDRKIVRDGAHNIAQRAIEAVKRSAHERAGFHISEPTWTGHRGTAGVVVSSKAKKSSHTVLQSAQIRSALKQLSFSPHCDKDVSAEHCEGSLEGAREQESEYGVHRELNQSDVIVAKTILGAFLDESLAGKRHCLTTGQVVQLLGPQIAAHHHDLFKELLKMMCQLSKPSRAGEPGVWFLRRKFWDAES